MNDLGVWLIKVINKVVPPPKMLEELDIAKLRIPDYQDWEYNEAIRITPEFGRLWQIKNKNILDVGSGLGGKPLFYAEQGAKIVSAIDLRFVSSTATLNLALQHGYQNILSINSNAAQIPFPNNYFDVIVSINVMEHVDDPLSSLAECKRVLKPGGLFFLHFPPFYSPWGAHLEGWINFPWPHVVFSDKTLLKAADQIDQEKQKNTDYIPTARFKWISYDRLPELNRITVDKFLKLIKEVDLIVLESTLLPFGRHYLTSKGIFGRLVFSLLRFLGQLPLLKEIITTKMVFALTKSSINSKK